VRHARTLGTRLVDELAELAMPHGRVEVRVNANLPEGRWTEQGTDAVELFLCANPGEALRPLANVASGGELARVMLALKTLASTDAPGKTLLFDEVDAGIGGAAAGRVGARLRDLGATFQVLCVTHAPQIAAAAGTHHRVSKTVRRGRTRTVVERLDREERIREIARLMTGSVSGAATASARELLENQSAGG
jgi:DNA repair protein RecN (Recombination protein N)